MFLKFHVLILAITFSSTSAQMPVITPPPGPTLGPVLTPAPAPAPAPAPGTVPGTVPGTCSRRHQVCSSTYIPVCGSNGVTYVNDCKCHEASEYEVCQGRSALTCASGACGRQPGSLCTPRPGICPLVYSPVRGTNGREYPNACECHRESERDVCNGGRGFIPCTPIRGRP